MRTKPEPIQNVTLTGLFHGVMEKEGSTCRAICTVAPDSDELEGTFEGKQIPLRFNPDFDIIMKEVGLRRRLGSPVLFHEPCRVRGSLRRTPYSTCQFELVNITSLEILEKHTSYRPNRVYEISYVLWFSDKDFVLRDCRSMDELVTVGAAPVPHVRARGFLVVNPFTEVSVLVPYEDFPELKHEDVHAPYEKFTELEKNKSKFLIDCNFASVIYYYLPMRSTFPDPPDIPPIFGGWAVIDGDFRPPDSGVSAAGVISNITCVSIESNRRLLQRIWWDPTTFAWHTHDVEEAS